MKFLELHEAINILYHNFKDVSPLAMEMFTLQKSGKNELAINELLGASIAQGKIPLEQITMITSILGDMKKPQYINPFAKNNQRGPYADKQEVALEFFMDNPHNGLSYAQIAKKLGISSRTVRRAEKKIKETGLNLSMENREEPAWKQNIDTFLKNLKTNYIVSNDIKTLATYTKLTPHQIKLQLVNMNAIISIQSEKGIRNLIGIDGTIYNHTRYYKLTEKHRKSEQKIIIPEAEPLPKVTSLPRGNLQDEQLNRAIVILNTDLKINYNERGLAIIVNFPFKNGTKKNIWLDYCINSKKEYVYDMRPIIVSILRLQSSHGIKNISQLVKFSQNIKEIKISYGTIKKENLTLKNATKILKLGYILNGEALNGRIKCS
jgi:DNA-binding Lrp family transcriptional regulator